MVQISTFHYGNWFNIRVKSLLSCADFTAGEFGGARERTAGFQGV
jgi:hypothetical protein